MTQPGWGTAPPNTFCALIPMFLPRGLLFWTPRPKGKPRNMETHALPKAQVPTLESLEMASRVGVRRVGQAFGKGRSLGH